MRDPQYTIISVRSHGDLYGDQYTLPANKKIITLSNLGKSVLDMDDSPVPQLIDKLYEMGHTLFLNNDTNPNRLTNIGEILLKKINNMFSSNESVFQFKLHMGGTKVNNMRLFFDKGCRDFRQTELFRDAVTIPFCSISALKPSEPVDIKSCDREALAELSEVRGARNILTLKDLTGIRDDVRPVLLERSQDKTIIITACRNIFSEVSEENRELMRLTSSNVSRIDINSESVKESNLVNKLITDLVDTYNASLISLDIPELISIENKHDIDEIENIKQILSSIDEQPNNDIKKMINKNLEFLFHLISITQPYIDERLEIESKNIAMIKVLLDTTDEPSDINIQLFKYILKVTPYVGGELLNSDKPHIKSILELELTNIKIVELSLYFIQNSGIEPDLTLTELKVILQKINGNYNDLISHGISTEEAYMYLANIYIIISKDKDFLQKAINKLGAHKTAGAILKKIRGIINVNLELIKFELPLIETMGITLVLLQSNVRMDSSQIKEQLILILNVKSRKILKFIDEYLEKIKLNKYFVDLVELKQAFELQPGYTYEETLSNLHEDGILRNVEEELLILKENQFTQESIEEYLDKEALTEAELILWKSSV